MRRNGLQRLAIALLSALCGAIVGSFIYVESASAHDYLYPWRVSTNTVYVRERPSNLLLEWTNSEAIADFNSTNLTVMRGGYPGYMFIGISGGAYSQLGNMLGFTMVHRWSLLEGWTDCYPFGGGVNSCYGDNKTVKWAYVYANSSAPEWPRYHARSSFDRWLVTHEIGHAVGLAHAMFSDASVMWEAPSTTFPFPYVSLQTLDRTNINGMYP